MKRFLLLSLILLFISCDFFEKDPRWIDTSNDTSIKIDTAIGKFKFGWFYDDFKDYLDRQVRIGIYEKDTDYYFEITNDGCDDLDFLKPLPIRIGNPKYTHQRISTYNYFVIDDIFFNPEDNEPEWTVIKLWLTCLYGPNHYDWCENKKEGRLFLRKGNVLVEARRFNELLITISITDLSLNPNAIQVLSKFCPKKPKRH